MTKYLVVDQFQNGSTTKYFACLRPIILSGWAAHLARCLLYPTGVATFSPTLEGFRAAFRRPSLTLGEIAWRWVTGATATAVFFFGFFEYLDTLPVTNGELLFLRTRHPYLVAQAMAHIFRGSLGRAVMSALLAAMLLGLLWMMAGAVGRIATVGALLDYFRDSASRGSSLGSTEWDKVAEKKIARESVPGGHAMPALVRLNFLRAVVALAAVVGFLGAAILAGFASPDMHPRPGLAFLLFMPLAGIVCLAWGMLNWLLSLAGLFAVRDGADTVGAIFSAVRFCRERAGPVAAVSTWTWLAHLVTFVGATTVVSMPLGFAGLLPGRLILFVMLLITVAYFAVADWLYMARLAGYVCIAEMPEEMLRPLPYTPPVPAVPRAEMPALPTPLQGTIDRDELILSDVPGMLPPSSAASS